MARRVTIRDVAASAGVSVASASLALRDLGQLSDATRAAVKRAADDLGYRANPHARSLRGAPSRVLALTLPALRPEPDTVGEVEWYARMMAAAVAGALAEDRALVVVPPTVDALDRLAVDGVIVVDPVTHDPLLDALAARAVQVVTVGRPLGRRDDAFPVVDCDYVAGTRTVLDHLVDAGARRPALLLCDLPASFHADASQAYDAWCREHGIAAAVGVAPSPDREHAEAAAERLLDAAPDVDALYVTFTRVARAALTVAARRGLVVPDDLRVATCSDSALVRDSTPPLTVLDDRPDAVGAAAVERLLTLLDAPDDRTPRRIETRLIVRGSTRRPEGVPAGR